MRNEIIKQYWIDKLGQEWTYRLKDTLESDYGTNLMTFIEQIYLSEEVIYPIKDRLFLNFKKCSIKDVKIVIIDNKPSADIRASGIGRGIISASSLHKDIPLELRNFRDCIYETIYGGQQSITNFDNSLYEYANSDILFLNSSMCISKEKNYDIIWRHFIRNVIKDISDLKTDVLFVFLTGDNDDLMNFIDENDHKIIKHPEPVIMSYDTVFKEIDSHIEKNYNKYDYIVW